VIRQAYEFYVREMGFRPATLEHDYSVRVEEAGDLVAEDGGVMGVLVLVENPDHFLVENIAVAAEWQGRGVGRALMRSAGDEASNTGCLSCGCLRTL
jgi:GNAT superfamily N-acetyltransferase